MDPATAAVAVLEAAWDLSLIAVPPLYIAALGYGLLRLDGTAVERVVASQRDLVLQYGLMVVAGLVAGGVAAVLVAGRAGTWLGTGIAGLSAVVAAAREDPVEPRDIDLGAWRDRLALAWLAVPAVALAGLVTGDLVVRSVAALVFYSTIFWEL